MNGSTWHYNWSRGVSRISALICGLAILAYSASAGAETFTLDDSSSPIAVAIDGVNALVTVTEKSGGVVWRNGTPDDGDALALTDANQESPLRFSARASSAGGLTFGLSLELDPAKGDLIVAINDASTSLSEGLRYPYPFFTGDGGGHAVMPVNGGYVFPNAETRYARTFTGGNLTHRRMEWTGGVDAENSAGWICEMLTPDDCILNGMTATVEGQEVWGGVFRWLGSNANPEQAPGMLSYERKARLRFYSSGGYVALTKHFRETARENGWLKTLAEKIEEIPATEKLIGAPVIYAWGDARQSAFLDELKAAGMEKAMIMLSVNHSDHQSTFPCAEFPEDDGWAKAVRERGYLYGFYDIYISARTGGGGGGGRGGARGGEATRGGEAARGDGAAAGEQAARGAARGEEAAPAAEARRGGGGGGVGYNGFSYLWPSNVFEWNYVSAGGSRAGGPGRGGVCAQMQVSFARDVRLPRHIAQFDIDSYLFDTTCAAAMLNECYDTEHGHYASRGQDTASRAALLDTAYSSPDKRLITGAEQARSWAVPYLHWAEGVFWLGTVDIQRVIGADKLGRWNDNAYPQIELDSIDPTAIDAMGALLTDGYQVPLWNLVYHDCMVDTVHWERPHNKYMYAWDHADLSTILRGQAPLLNMVYKGEQGRANRVPATLTDAEGNIWSPRWTDMRDRFMQCYENVCKWHETVGLMEMTDHRWLAGDRSVQLAEFSSDGGKTGKGVVVNFGVFDGEHSMAGPDWSGEIRGRQLTVPVNDFETYEW